GGVAGSAERGAARLWGSGRLATPPPLPADLGAHDGGQPRHVSPGPRIARDESAPHWIRDADHHDGDRPGGLLGGYGVLIRGHDDHVRFESHELRGERRYPLVLTLGDLPLDGEVAALHVAELP